jgi:hypothetical protein
MNTVSLFQPLLLPKKRVCFFFITLTLSYDSKPFTFKVVNIILTGRPELLRSSSVGCWCNLLYHVAPSPLCAQRFLLAK